MENTYWHKQQQEKPLYPELLWSRPENRLSAGKLLIMGGNLHSFAVAAESFDQVTKSGIGTARVVLPSALQRTVGKIFKEGEYAPSTPSGSFSKLALSTIIDASDWADGVLIAGDLGRNAETAILLETLLQKSSIPVVITQDAVDYISSTPQTAIQRKNIALVLSLSQLQRLVITLKYKHAVTFSMDLLRLTEWLHEFTLTYPIHIVTEHNNVILVAVNGEVSTTRLIEETPIWRVKTASKMTVWWLQNMDKPFQAFTTAVVAP
jgi:hypothetical protein